MAKYGLRKNPTFESLLDSGNEYDFSDVTVYNRAALNFRQGFFGPAAPIEELVDEENDDKHEAVLARMRAAAAEFDRQVEQARERARNAYRAEAMPRHHAAHEAPGPRPAPRENILPEPQTFQDRLRQRQEQYMQQPHFDFRKDMNRLRQEARQAAERNVRLNQMRRVPAQFNISTPPSSPPPSPRDYDARLQGRYDQRLVGTMARRNPRVQRPQTAPPRTNERLDQARQSAAQIARKRERPPRGEIVRRVRRKTPYGPAS